jgi:hypothetical protein
MRPLRLSKACGSPGYVDVCEGTVEVPWLCSRMRPPSSLPGYVDVCEGTVEVPGCVQECGLPVAYLVMLMFVRVLLRSLAVFKNAASQ